MNYLALAYVFAFPAVSVLFYVVCASLLRWSERG